MKIDRLVITLDINYAATDEARAKVEALYNSLVQELEAIRASMTFTTAGLEYDPRYNSVAGTQHTIHADVDTGGNVGQLLRDTNRWDYS